ncbi:MAG: hypothetical protein E6586_08250 [Bifidobacterium scardovii]|uniref:hypothetical protein n=1 Tax=Bifidobacterium scardovii TaxID=158787 RepID=UPI00066947C2|nr:hypothetical protein [Bifidobacterium scardovii]MBS6948132.1 hypothetical protein [Bifidobacterium scardovii]MDU3736924.1 hypothetical protein [Bifidobacterium scardovii]MDU5298071.1 hypothetical protein [Bifidobacterium scardovii]MDU5611069.1 hypothetical protein [Bifidobacterium scardovii]MDU5887554.1 hypothetical protein [Bifidobacterium scardovii]
MTTRIAKIAAAALALTVSLSLAGCEGQIPKPATDGASASKTTPDLTEAQEKRLRKQILATLSAANDAKNTDGLAARLTGPQLEIHTARIAIAQKTGSVSKFATIPEDIAQTVIPTDSGWPRSVFTITTTTEDQQSKRLLVLTQDSARQNYKLWGVARLFQGAKLPNFAVPKIGSQMGTAKDTGLTMTPQEAVTQYADVLTNGANSQYAANFADDNLRQTIAEQTQNVQTGVERNKGTQQQTFTPVDGAIQVMRSTDGGDLVVAQINSEWTRQAGEGRTSLPASDNENALFGDTTATSGLKATYTFVVAMYVPPKDSGQQITAVGADREVVKVEAI